MKNLLSIQALSAEEIGRVLDLTAKLKAERGRHDAHPLRHQCWAMIFDKSSTRTRVSFEVGIRELGGDPVFLNASDIQLGRGEPIEDTARVMGRMLHGAVIRTQAQSDVENFAKNSGLPTVNALTDDEHPCQILADIFTLREKLGEDLSRRTVCFIGDGACNVARSWAWAAAKLGFTLKIAAPKQYQPDAEFLARLKSDRVQLFEDAQVAAKGADVLYTDVWVSMGKEEEATYRTAQLGSYQINAELVKLAAPKALVMHCLPAYRGKEITAEVFDQHARTIFDQAENRLHAQKAVMTMMAEARLLHSPFEIRH